MTNFVDAETCELLFMVEGRKAEAFAAFAEALRAHGGDPDRIELIAPYAPVVDINVESLPSGAEVTEWTSGQFVAALAHDKTCPAYAPHFRQFLHVSFKVAAKMGPRFTEAL